MPGLTHSARPWRTKRVARFFEVKWQSEIGFSIRMLLGTVLLYGPEWGLRVFPQEFCKSQAAQWDRALEAALLELRVSDSAGRPLSDSRVRVTSLGDPFDTTMMYRASSALLKDPDAVRLLGARDDGQFEILLKPGSLSLTVRSVYEAFN